MAIGCGEAWPQRAELGDCVHRVLVDDSR
jgi:hypothetical protein